MSSAAPRRRASGSPRTPTTPSKSRSISICARVNLAAWTGMSREQAAQKARDLTGLVQRLPTQTRRDEEMDEFQQFSTPPALAFVANWTANVRAEDIMLEPSAGTGDLAIWSELAGAKLMLNELSERRRELLTDLFPDATVTGENAEQLHNILPRASVPTVVVMNPPFSATAGRVQGQRKTANGAQTSRPGPGAARRQWPPGGHRRRRHGAGSAGLSRLVAGDPGPLQRPRQHRHLRARVRQVRDDLRQSPTGHRQGRTDPRPGAGRLGRVGVRITVTPGGHPQ